MTPSMATTETATAVQPALETGKLLTKDTCYGDFRDDLARDGFAIVKGAIAREKAEAYGEKFYSYLENFGLGYKRDDPSTIKRALLPVVSEKGMILNYGVSHENFVWQIRSEPGVIAAFETVYQTPDLIVSFDGVNIGFHDRSDFAPNTPWPHQDQDPLKPGFRCLQGLVNLQPCGPDDGGLITCKGAHLLSEDFHRDMAAEEKIPAWTKEWYGFTAAGMAWLAEHNCPWVKICAEPGDLILWDSRTPHYNVPSTSKQDRMAVYTCYMPVADASQDDLRKKKEAFEKRLGTTHWPNARHVGSNVAKREGVVDALAARERPIEEPILGERAFRLTGIPYIRV